MHVIHTYIHIHTRPIESIRRWVSHRGSVIPYVNDTITTVNTND